MKTKILLIILLVINYQLLFCQGVALNTSGANAHQSAGLDIQFDNKGLLIPRLSTSERSAITSPANGLQIYNTTINCFEFFNGSAWKILSCGCDLPATTVTGTHLPSQTEIVWNWNTVPDATGYKYNTTNNYYSATDNGNNTTFTQSGLTCNTAYTLYVWAYNNCGNSTETTLTQTTAPCFTCGDNVSFDYRGLPVTYGSVNGQNGTCWLDRNIGANQVANAYNDANAYGDLFQWGRLDDGHQLRISTTTSTLSNTSNPGHSKFIIGTIWYSGSNPDNLWQGVNGINNPCPSGWRLPTDDELNNEANSWLGGLNYIGAFQSSLKLTASGYRPASSGSLNYEGSRGRYWSSTISSINPYIKGLKFDNSTSSSADFYRADGMSVRCIKDY